MEPNMRLRLCALNLALGLLLSATTALQAHELQVNRTTAVLRDDTHLSLSHYILYTEALHQALAPKMSRQEFMLSHAAMKPADLEKRLQDAHRQFEQGFRVNTAAGKALVLNWRWPQAAQVQALFQQGAMQAVVDPHAHSHEEPLEIQTEASHAGLGKGISVQFPAAWGRVLLVWYRPQQVWAEPKTATPIRF
jgi:hypothetical protein